VNIYLIGYRGTGKSTVAPLLAELLGKAWSAVDLDEQLQCHAGRTIADIFAIEGEAGFRDREQEALHQAARQDRLVVATGGGVVGRTENRELLEQGRVVWLTASVAVIVQRLAADDKNGPQRPDLTVQGGREEIERLLAVREPIYRELAELTLVTDSRSPQEIARNIADRWPDLHTRQ
jgi:shikimate kinase